MQITSRRRTPNLSIPINSPLKLEEDADGNSTHPYIRRPTTTRQLSIIPPLSTLFPTTFSFKVCFFWNLKERKKTCIHRFFLLLLSPSNRQSHQLILFVFPQRKIYSSPLNNFHLLSLTLSTFPQFRHSFSLQFPSFHTFSLYSHFILFSFSLLHLSPIFPSDLKKFLKFADFSRFPLKSQIIAYFLPFYL